MRPAHCVRCLSTVLANYLDTTLFVIAFPKPGANEPRKNQEIKNDHKNFHQFPLLCLATARASSRDFVIATT